MSKLTVVGSINADLIVHAERHPQPGETLLGSGGDILAGGTVSYTHLRAHET